MEQLAISLTSFFNNGENPNNEDLPLVMDVDSNHYKGPIWDKYHPMHVTIIPINRRCEPMCYTQEQIPLHITWVKTINYVQGYNAGPTTANQIPNAIERITVHLIETWQNIKTI